MAKNGNGCYGKEPFSISVDPRLMDALKDYCKHEDYNPSLVIGWAVKEYLARKIFNNSEVWEKYFTKLEEEQNKK